LVGDARAQVLEIVVMPGLNNSAKALMPFVALGVGGLVPFVALSREGQRLLPHEVWLAPLRELMGRPSLNATELQVTYGAAILAFLGGPHWGFAIRGRLTTLQLLWGVTPPLIAWPAASTPAPASLDLLSFGLGASLLVDAAFSLVKLVPWQYLLLRSPLTIVAAWALQSNKQKDHSARWSLREILQ